MSDAKSGWGSTLEGRVNQFYSAAGEYGSTAGGMLKTGLAGAGLVGLLSAGYAALTGQQSKALEYFSDGAVLGTGAAFLYTIGAPALNKVKDLTLYLLDHLWPDRKLAYTVPALFDWYDPAYDAEELAKDVSLKCKHISHAAIEKAVIDAHDNAPLRKYLIRPLARVADTLDKIMSLYSIYLLGDYGSKGKTGEGITAHLYTEAIEAIPKIPVLLYLLPNHPEKATTLAFIEGLTVAGQGLGDVYDIVQNPYVRAIDATIREDAKRALLEKA